MTRGEMRTRVLRGELNDSPTAPVYWTLDEIHDYLQEGYEVLAEAAPLVMRTFTIPRRPGTQVYQLPGVGEDILVPWRIWLPDLKRRLEARTLRNLDDRQERWLDSTGEPWWWYPVSWDQFGIWPPPTTGSGWLEVTCAVWPAALTDDGDEPEFLPSRHQDLVTYAAWLGHLKQWRGAEAAEALRDFFAAGRSTQALLGVQQIQEHFFPRTDGDDRRRVE
jgi:hypothetical protein